MRQITFRESSEFGEKRAADSFLYRIYTQMSITFSLLCKYTQFGEIIATRHDNGSPFACEMSKFSNLAVTASRFRGSCIMGSECPA